MPEYPRLLNLSDNKLAELTSFIDDLLQRSQMERELFVKRIESWQRDYWAEPKSEVNEFPFVGASNIIIPITAIAFETVHARTMTTAFGLDQIVAGKAINPEWADKTRAVEQFLDFELKRSDFKSNIESAIIEIEKFGTGVSKTLYEQKVKYGIKEVDGVEIEFPIYEHGCRVYSTPIARFIFPFEASSLDSAMFVGEELDLTEYQVQMYEYAGRFYEGTHEKLMSYYNSTSSTATGEQFRNTQENLDKVKPVFPTRITVYELYLPYDVDNTGRPKEIVVHYHQPSRQFLAITYNTASDLSRPYEVGVYMAVEHRIHGIGIAKQSDMFQAEITALHRQRLDAGTLANTKMWKLSSMSQYSSKEPIRPNKIWILDDMSHLEPVQQSEVYPSASNNEYQTLQYVQQRTGVNEVTLGMPQVGTPGTATSDLARIQEGKAKFDYGYGNIKDFLSRTIVQVAACIQRHGPRKLEYSAQTENGEYVRQWLTLPEQSIRDGMIIELTAAGQHRNKLLERQDWQQIAQLLQQYLVGMIQIAQMTGDQQLTSLIIQKAMSASTEALRQILETFNIRNADRLYIKELLTHGLNGIPRPGGVEGATSPDQIGAIPDLATLIRGG